MCPDPALPIPDGRAGSLTNQTSRRHITSSVTNIYFMLHLGLPIWFIYGALFYVNYAMCVQQLK